MSAPLIELRGLGRSYAGRDGAQPVLWGVDLTIRQGEFVAIVGRSGSGKSTLMNLIGLLDRPSLGSYWLEGRESADLAPDARAVLRRDVFGFVFQRYHLLPDATARENVELPGLYAGLPMPERRARAERLLTRLGLGDRLDHRPAQLSGGQQQRVAIARALMNDPRAILADEPTGALDSASGQAVMAFLRELAAEGRTVILVTHDLDLAQSAGRIVEICDGRILSDAATDAGPTTSAAPLRLPSVAADGGRGRGLPWRELLRGSFAALGANRLRTALTLIGIVIGAASVIALLAIGEGARARVMERAAATGADWIVVLPDNDDPTRPGGRLTLADAEVVAGLPNVRLINPGRWTSVTLVAGGVSERSEAFASGSDYVEMLDWPAERGVFFTEADARAAAPVVVLGASVADRLYGDADPVGAHLLVENISFLVTGVLEATRPPTTPPPRPTHSPPRRRSSAATSAAGSGISPVSSARRGP